MSLNSVAQSGEQARGCGLTGSSGSQDCFLNSLSTAGPTGPLEVTWPSLLILQMGKLRSKGAKALDRVLQLNDRAVILQIGCGAISA